MDFENSQTKKNLLFAFAGESQARNKYTYFASQAKKEGFESIANIFLETANNEKEHAKVWFKYLNKGNIPITEFNLLSSIAGEHEEWVSMYKNFAEVARCEGFSEIADKFEAVALIEKKHEERYKKILDDLKKDSIFISKDVVIWKCSNCGYIHVGKEAPNKCPVCDHPKGYFEICYSK